jgi:hypothetical protein
MTERTPPPALLAKITADLRPVKPVRSAEKRGLAVLAIAAVTAAILLSILGMRRDLESFASPWFLTMLVMRVGAGTLLVLLALKDAIPGARSIGTAMKIAAAFGAIVLFTMPAVFAWTLKANEGTIGPPLCYPSILVVAIPSFAGLLWLLMRAYPLHPLRTAALAGLGTGILAEAAQFVACSNASPAHGAIIHGGAAVTIAGFGAVAGAIIALRRRRALSFS